MKYLILLIVALLVSCDMRTANNQEHPEGLHIVFVATANDKDSLPSEMRLQWNVDGSELTETHKSTHYKREAQFVLSIPGNVDSVIFPQVFMSYNGRFLKSRWDIRVSDNKTGAYVWLARNFHANRIKVWYKKTEHPFIHRPPGLSVRSLD